MKLTYLGKTVLSGDTNCPSLYKTDRGTYVVQGWRLTDPEALAQLDLPPNETVVEIPPDVLELHLSQDPGGTPDLGEGAGGEPDLSDTPDLAEDAGRKPDLGDDPRDFA